MDRIGRRREPVAGVVRIALGLLLVDQLAGDVLLEARGGVAGAAEPVLVVAVEAVGVRIEEGGGLLHVAGALGRRLALSGGELLDGPAQAEVEVLLLSGVDAVEALQGVLVQLAGLLLGHVPAAVGVLARLLLLAGRGLLPEALHVDRKSTR